MSGAPFEPLTPDALAARLADLAVADLPSVPAGQRAVRLAIDGPVAQDGADLADAVAAALSHRAVPVLRVRAEHFLRARSLRLEFGADPEAFGEGWYDLAALRREVLDRVGPDGDGHWLARLRDPATDRPFREPSRPAPAGSVVVLDGRFLARWEIADAIDVRVHLDVSPAARARRVPADERDVVLPAWASYLQWYDPAASARVVVRHDRPSHPALRREPPDAPAT